MIKNLQIFFAYLIKSDKKYADPTDVALSIIDDNGKIFVNEDHGNIIQFNNCFLLRV